MKLKEARRIIQLRAQVAHGPGEYVLVDEALNAGMAWADEIISCAGTGIGVVRSAPMDLEPDRDVYPSGGFDRVVLVETKIRSGTWLSHNYFPFASGDYLESRSAPGLWWTAIGESAIRIWPAPMSGLSASLRIWGYPAHRVSPKGDADSQVIFAPHSRAAVLWYATMELPSAPAIAKKAERSLSLAEMTFRKHVEIPQSGAPTGMMKEAR